MKTFLIILGLIAIQFSQSKASGIGRKEIFTNGKKDALTLVPVPERENAAPELDLNEENGTLPAKRMATQILNRKTTYYAEGETACQRDPNSNGCYAREGICSNDPFISSTQFRNGKVYLHPWDPKERVGDWYFNEGFCRKHCAEMVTIQSEDENNHLNKWMRQVGIQHPGAWLGAQIQDAKAIFKWETREAVTYSNPAPGEFNELGTTCMHIGWDASPKWWNYYCTTKTMYVLCQRSLYRNTNKELVE